MEVRPYRLSDRYAAQQLADRLAAKNPRLTFAVPDTLHDDYHAKPRLVEQFVAVDQGGLHGGFELRYDPVYIDDQAETLSFYAYPISEGVINRRYAFLGLQLQQHAEECQDFLYGIGGGGLSRPVNQLKLRAGWSGWDVPFFFYVNNPVRFLHGIPALQSSPTRRFLAHSLARSGIGWATLKSTHFFRSNQGRRLARSVSYEIQPQFDEWTDDLFSVCRSEYKFIARRDRVLLNKLFPAEASNVKLGVVSYNGQRIGWFVVVVPMCNKSQHFGELSVGLIADFLAHPSDAAKVIWSATDYLRSHRVDVLVCNASHHDWRCGLLQNGFFQGPSNWPFMASPKLSDRLAPFPNSLDHSHITRGDGDGIYCVLKQDTQDGVAA